MKLAGQQAFIPGRTLDAKESLALTLHRQRPTYLWMAKSYLLGRLVAFLERSIFHYSMGVTYEAMRKCESTL